jgi:hypothetical protein
MEAHGPTRTFVVSVVTVGQVSESLRAAAQERTSAESASPDELLGPLSVSLKPSGTVVVKFANALELRLSFDSSDIGILSGRVKCGVAPVNAAPFLWPPVLFQRDGTMPRKNSSTYQPGLDEAGFAVALVCLLMSVAPPLMAWLVPASFEELSRIDGLHRVCAICSTVFSFCVLLVGYGFNRLRLVLICNVAGSVLLAIACITGTNCCSGLIAWIQGHISLNDLPEGTLLSAAFSPGGSLFQMAGHSLNLRWARMRSGKSKLKEK